MATTLKITQVTYGRTVSTGNYQNSKFELTAVVQQNQTWEEVFDALRAKCADLAEQIKQDGA